MNGIENRLLLGVEGLLQEAGDGPLLKALRLIESLEERGSLDEAVARVRPRLAVLRPIRSIGLRRLVTLPFEDLLVPPDSWVAGRGRIDRARLGELHAAILPGLAPDLVARARAGGRGRFMNEQGAVLALGQELWPAASAALHRYLATVESTPSADRALAEQMRSVGLLLNVAPAVVPLLWRLPPRPMPELIDDERRAALDLIRFGRAGGPQLLELLFHLLLARTASPATVLDLPFAAELLMPAREVEPLVARASAACLAELVPPPATARQGRALAAAADGIERTVSWVRSLEGGSSRLGIDRATLRDIRGKVARSIGSHLAEVVVGALPQQFAQLRADQAAPDNLVAEAEEAARAVRRIGMAGRELGIGDTVDRTLGQARPLFVGPVSAGPSDLGAMDRARIVEILFGPEAAMAVLRPGEAGGR
ncbi:MAG TPA: hypothetical protein PKA13_03100 [Geminicoccaceae bacterium]|nr:hypothetical protein [Geminicoccus sp.]HMU48734.1 hypothetical protein [Geminicoccaceae bacterium]